MTIRPLIDSEIAESHRVLAELRTTLSRDDFLAALSIQQKAGYYLVGAFDPELVGMMGMRPVHTLARGWHIHVDDLVVTQNRRKQGIGEALLQFAEEEARKRGMKFVFLDAVETAMGFYAKEGYRNHSATLMRKSVVQNKSDAHQARPGLPPRRGRTKVQ